MITYEAITSTDYALTPEGSEIASRGSHEAVLWAALPAKGEGEPLSIPELKVRGPCVRQQSLTKLTYLLDDLVQKMLGEETTKVGQSRAFRNKWISKEGAGFVKTVGRCSPP